MPTANRDLNKLYKRQTMLQILTFTMITIFIWVGFSIFRSQQKTAISAEQRKLASPLTPSINNQVLDELQAKTYYSESELEDFPIYQILVEEANTRKQTEQPTTEKETTIESSIPIDLGAILNQSSQTENATPEAEIIQN